MSGLYILHPPLSMYAKSAGLATVDIEISLPHWNNTNIPKLFLYPKKYRPSFSIISHVCIYPWLNSFHSLSLRFKRLFTDLPLLKIIFTNTGLQRNITANISEIIIYYRHRQGTVGYHLHDDRNLSVGHKGSYGLYTKMWSKYNKASQVYLHIPLCCCRCYCFCIPVPFPDVGNAKHFKLEASFKMWTSDGKERDRQIK